MTQTRLHPDLWYPIAQLLAALRQLLRATAPEAFAQIALDARAHLAAITAMVRRYIHILAADITLPPRAISPSTDHPEERASARGGRRDYLFPLIESPSKPSRATLGEDPPELQWALLMEAAQRLVAVMANPPRRKPSASRAPCAAAPAKPCANSPSAGPSSAASAPRSTCCSCGLISFHGLRLGKV